MLTDMRLFTAIELEPNILLRLERLLAALRPEAVIYWSPLDNLHITTKFIGLWPERKLDELSGTLQGLTDRPTFHLKLRHLGWYPDERSPRVLWCGADGGEDLLRLARETEERLIPMGISCENRDYSPHLTLARIKTTVPLTQLRARVQELQPAAIGEFKVSGFTLFRSDPGPNASIYRPLRHFSFGRAAAAQ